MNNRQKQILTISVLSLFLFTGSLTRYLTSGAIAAPTKKGYGLGVPISSGTGGAVRSGLNSLVIPLAPGDGGRTASEQQK